MRDAQLADFKTNKIPAAATDGSVNWVRMDDVPVTGRVVVISRHGGVASSYDCCVCPCPADYTTCYITPPPPSWIGPHALMRLCCMAEYQDCNLVVYENDVTINVKCTWSSSNTTVASMDGTALGQVDAHAARTADITATF